MRTYSLDSRRLVVVGLLAGVLFAGAQAAPAFAHDTIESSTPAAGEVVTTSLSAVNITFSDDLTSVGGVQNALIQVTDASGGHHESGCVTTDGAAASTSVALGEAGVYSVLWHVVSSDGHPVEGAFTFSWQPSAVTMAAPSLAEAPGCGDDWSGTTSSAAAGSPSGASGTDPTGSTGSDSAGSTGSASTGAAAGSSGQSAPLASDAPVPAGSATALPRPTMTILSAVPAEATDHSSLALPVAVGVAIGGLAALSALVVWVTRRLRNHHFSGRGR
ncbi:copper resistance CopC family protein [Subtercola vilae]|uniref:copper resistance CopC family protein n=1 Tax=Subtercola vilae TaxID=2056433 RepID=UPI0013761F16|nr:copper resistance CopC family protein [Subtercola vilae]